MIYSIDEEDEVPRLMLYALQQLGVRPSEIDALVRQAITEVMDGRHAHHSYAPRLRFRSLCAVMTTIVMAQRERKRGSSGRG